MRNLVVHRAAVLRVRVADHTAPTATRIGRRFENRLECAGRAGNDNFWDWGGLTLMLCSNNWLKWMLLL